MFERPLVSVVITNHNYGCFLRDAIDSALHQTYRHSEVLVVDDGSTDNSRSVIDAYGASLHRLYQDQHGQTAAMNAGLGAAAGDIVCFLDSDDVLLADTVERAVSAFASDDVVNVHWPLRVIAADGTPTGELLPRDEDAQGRIKRPIDSRWSPSLVMPPGSGHAWSGAFVRRVMPLPTLEQGFGVGSASADTALFMLAQVEGETRRLDGPGGFYRVHDLNSFARLSVAAQIERQVPILEQHFQLLARHCARAGLSVDPDRWRRDCYVNRMLRGNEAIRDFVTSGERFILLDDDQWNHHFGDDEVVEDRFAVSLPNRPDGHDGRPRDSTAAIAELERIRAEGVRILAVAWSAFWWLEYYGEFHEHVRSHYPCLHESDDMLIFALGSHT